MAQNTWINVGADKNAATRTDGDGRHSVAGGGSASGDFTVSFDSAVITSLNIYDSVARQARQRAIAGGLK